MRSSINELVLIAGRSGPDRMRAGARLMSRLEDSPECLVEVLRATRHVTEARLVLGITGPPGCGKSSLVDALVGELRRSQPGSAVGVIAVDPSSPYSGGALLGDRVRMMRHATDPQVFVRSIASRGRLGGLSAGTRGVIRVLSLLGCDCVLIETVGVGQNEVDVANLTDLVLVVLSAGYGDAVQMLKSGLLEIGDAYVVNKSDQPGADQLVGRLLSMLAHAPRSGRGRSEPKVYATAATIGEGVENLLRGVERQVGALGAAIAERRHRGEVEAVRDLLLHRIRRRTEAALRDGGPAAMALDDVLAGRAGLDEAAGRIAGALARGAGIERN
jgi:LAO/AO transport system kinase